LSILTLQDEFGIGISLYFRQLAVLFGVVLLCALISLGAVTSNLSFNKNSSLRFYLKGSVVGADRSDLSFMKQGLTDIIITILLSVFAVLSTWIETRAIETIDTSQLTAQDYAVCVQNPPISISDPDDYYKHFKQFGDVVFVTIAKNNGPLLKSITLKKEAEVKRE
jgi:hypothetical protein